MTRLAVNLESIIPLAEPKILKWDVYNVYAMIAICIYPSSLTPQLTVHYLGATILALIGVISISIA